MAARRGGGGAVLSLVDVCGYHCGPPSAAVVVGAAPELIYEICA